MRIIAGKAKGKRLKSPTKDRSVRPLTDQAREALFNILGERNCGASFLDLFAGTGAVGIEALSRGAELAIFVEWKRPVALILRENLEATGFSDRAEVFTLEASKALELLDRKGARFDLIYVGAPYGSPAFEPALGAIGSSRLVKEAGWLIAEHRKQHQVAEKIGQLEKFRDAKYGETVLSFYKVAQ